MLRKSSIRRPLVVASAQLGPVNLADSRESVVARLVEMLREAAGRGASFVVGRVAIAVQNDVAVGGDVAGSAAAVALHVGAVSE